MKNLKTVIFIIITSLLLNACNGKLPGADARQFPPEPEKRIKKILKKAKDFD